MRSIFLLFVLFCVGFSGFSQYGDIYQSAALYKQNNVRSRVMMFNRAKVKTISIDNFNHDGVLTDHVEFDTSGKRYASKRILNRDSSGKIISEIIYNYSHFDTSKKNYYISLLPDTFLVRIEHDSLKKQVKRIRTKDGKIFSETTYNFESKVEFNKYFYADSSFLEVTIDYETPYIEKKITGILHKTKGEIQNWSITFKNVFDRSGRIKRRSSKRESDYPIDENIFLFFQEHDYQYMNNGLLLNIVSSDLSDNTGRKATRLFDYKFW